MQHIQYPPRPEDSEQLSDARKALGDYWSEGEAYIISRAQVKQLNEAAASISQLFKFGINYVLRTPELLKKFVFSDDAATNDQLHLLIKKSWLTNPSYILDRWDMAWDGVHPPQLLERNIGWVGLMVASSMVQEECGHWLTILSKKSRIYDGKLNGESMETLIVQAFKKAADECGLPQGSSIVTFAQDHDLDPEMFISGVFLNECAKQAGYQGILQDKCINSFEDGYAVHTKMDVAPIVLTHAKAAELKTYVEEMDLAKLLEIFGRDLSLRHAYIYANVLIALANDHKDLPDFSLTLDPSKAREPQQFKGGIFPYAGFPQFTEMVANYLKDNPDGELHSQTLIPYWTLLADHKGMLAVLHEMFPENPHIPPTFWGADALQGQKRIIKEALGCQGKHSVIFDAGNEIVADRRDGGVMGEHYITQAYCDAVYDAEGRYKVVNLFTANDVPAAIGTRVAPSAFVGGQETQTRYVPVLVCG